MKDGRKIFGGNGDDRGHSIRQTDDGGYIIAGITTSFGKGTQVYLIRLGVNGKKQWQKTYGGAENDAGYSVRQTDDGGYIIVGHTSSFGDGLQAYLVKTTANGKREWQRMYGGAGNDGGFSVEQTSDGGYIIAGAIDTPGKGYQVYMVKTGLKG